MDQTIVRKFRKYSNRKLYDLSSKKYTTLEDIFALVKTGQDVNVVLHGSGEDITAKTLVEAMNKVAAKGVVHSYDSLTSFIKSLTVDTTTQE